MRANPPAFSKGERPVIPMERIMRAISAQLRLGPSVFPGGGSMRGLRSARPCGGANVFATGCLLTTVTLMLAAAGCSSGGGASALFPHDYRLLRSARDLAASARPYGPIPRELQKQSLEAYYLQPGDVLLLEVTDLEADIRLPADQTIMPDGTIDLGEYGRIVIAGLTIEQTESLVLSTVQAVAKDQRIKPINVRLNVAESAVYYVLGEVN